MEDNKKIFILILCVALVVFSLPVYAEEETTQEETYEDSFTLQDVKEGRHLPEFMDFVGYVGESAEFVYSVYTKDIIGAVLSSMMAYKNPVRDWADEHSLILQDSLMGDVDFCESIKFLPKVMAVEWDKSTSDAVQKNENVVNRFTKPVSSCTEGFYPCFYANYWDGINYPAYYYITSSLSNSDVAANVYFASLPNNRVVCCSFSSLGTGGFTCDVYQTKSHNPPANNQDGTKKGSIFCRTSYAVDNNTYYYGVSSSLGVYGYVGDFNDRFPVVYSTAEDAAKAFYGFSASTEPVPNGEGYIRPIPEGKKIRATSKNIFNTDFSIYIQNNYNTYGADFVNVPIDDYPYTKPNPETPSWWYDIYRDPVAIPNDDKYTDLTNLELGTPATNDTSFLSACFAVIPERLSVMLVSLSVLWAVCCLFKKGD